MWKWWWPFSYLDAINNIMQQRDGMGQTGETYLVGPDKLMRSDSFLDPANHSVKASFAHPEKGMVDTEAAKEALSGKTGSKIIMDYNGNPVLSAFTPVKIGDTTWALIAEIDESEAFAAVKTIAWLIGIIALAGIIAIIIVAFLVSRAITLPINRIITGLGDGSDQVASASAEVSSSSQSLAEGASEQAAGIEETSSSLEEMSSMTRQNSDNAAQADQLMGEAKEIVGKANDSMGQLAVSMAEITRASEETSKIIKTIDEIAFQTNLLALNAAVEAARAGEAGAGFAVVADEVRNLALRAAEAAKNTSELIEGTTREVMKGSELTEGTNEAFGEVAESARKVAELVSEIAAASKEQSQGIEQVNTAVTEMDKVTQTNAANAEESAAASEELNAQAEQMKHFVNELVRLVEGKASQFAEAGQMIPKVQGPLPGSAPKPIEKLWRRRKKIPANKADNKKAPEEVIPFDNDNLEDF
jgi:methyl-accepting chemotaxis protein